MRELDYLPYFPCDENAERIRKRQLGIPDPEIKSPSLSWIETIECPDPPVKRPVVRAWPIGLTLIACGIITYFVHQENARYIHDPVILSPLLFVQIYEFSVGTALLVFAVSRRKSLLWWLAVLTLACCAWQLPLGIFFLIMTVISIVVPEWLQIACVASVIVSAVLLVPFWLVYRWVSAPYKSGDPSGGAIERT